jgi:hypothetical protein
MCYEWGQVLGFVIIGVRVILMLSPKSMIFPPIPGQVSDSHLMSDDHNG